MELPETTNQKTFSIIIASYNCGRKIEDTLQSVFSQNKELFELIVIDGASTDNTLDYIKKYEDGLTVISEKDGGVYYAFNKGIDLAKGKYIYFIGAGDCLKPGILEEVNELLPPETPSFVYGNCYFTKQKADNGTKFHSALFIQNNICHQGIFYHRDIFDIIGKYDLRYKVFADWFFNLKCFIHEGINKHYLPQCVVADYEEGGLSSVISRDPAFKKDFPIFVRKQFGVSKYLACKAFLANPVVFNYFHFKDYYSLLGYVTSNYPLTKYLVPVAKPFVRVYRHLKKAVRNKGQAS